jgi:hypothetical protein
MSARTAWAVLATVRMRADFSGMHLSPGARPLPSLAAADAGDCGAATERGASTPAGSALRP